MMKSLMILAAGFALNACAAPAETSAPTVSVETFTTEGKPTKTVETPWGERQVYDPTQDPEVIAAFEYVYRALPKRIDILDGDSEAARLELEREFNAYKSVFETIRTIQENDLLRLGCGQPITTRSCDFEEREAKTSIPKSCSNISFGEAELNACEMKNSSWVIKDVIALSQSPCLTDLQGEEHALMSFWQIGMKNNSRTETITDKNLPVEQKAQLESYFLSECRAFDE